MSERDEILAFLGLPAGAGLSEVERVYAWRCASVRDRLAAGDESARVELAALAQAYERLMGWSPAANQGRGAQAQIGMADQSGPGHALPAQSRLRTPFWWESYLSLLVALASLATLVVLALYLPHVYRKGGFLTPLALVALTALFSIAATMIAEGELQFGLRNRFLGQKGLDAQQESVRLRLHVARIASLLSRAVRWLAALALIATVLLNFASLSGHWSLRH